MKDYLKVFGLVVIIIFCFYGCDKPSINSAWIVLVDDTEQQDFEGKAITDFIFEKSDIDTNNIFTGSISVSITTLSDKFTNRVTKVELPSGGSVFTEITNERLATQIEFKRTLATSLDNAYKFTEERNISKLFTPICESLNDLMRQKSHNKKYCLIFSDCLENTKDVSFYKFKRNPQKLIKNKDEIISTLQKDCVLSFLSDVEIYVIYQPTVTTDDLFQQSKRFWTSLLNEKGGKVNFFANLH